MTVLSYHLRLVSYIGITILFVVPLFAQQQYSSSSLSEIFLLDLGIVIEPRTGLETYSRRIQAPSKEVSFRIKKVHSGSVYMAASRELLSAIERINVRISDMETLFKNELMALRVENHELKTMLANFQPIMDKPEKPNMVIATPEPQLENDIIIVSLPEVNSIQMEPLPPKKTFNQRVYMAGVFAYQREDFTSALEYFAKLHLELASMETADNVMYWTADAYQHVHDNQKALDVLNKLLKNHNSDRMDDALVKKGLIHKKMGHLDLAMQAFGRIVNEYPNSEYTRLASMELKRVEMALQ